MSTLVAIPTPLPASPTPFAALDPVPDFAATAMAGKLTATQRPVAESSSRSTTPSISLKRKAEDDDGARSLVVPLGADFVGAPPGEGPRARMASKRPRLSCSPEPDLDSLMVEAPHSESSTTESEEVVEVVDEPTSSNATEVSSEASSSSSSSSTPSTPSTSTLTISTTPSLSSSSAEPPSPIHPLSAPSSAPIPSSSSSTSSSPNPAFMQTTLPPRRLFHRAQPTSPLAPNPVPYIRKIFPFLRPARYPHCDENKCFRYRFLKGRYLNAIEQYKHQALSYPYQAYRPSTSRTHTFEDGSDSDSDSDEDEDDEYIETSYSHEMSFDSSMTLSSSPSTSSSTCSDLDLSNIDPALLEEDRGRALSGGVALGMPSSTRFGGEVNEDDDEDGEFEIEDDLTLWSNPDSVPATPSSRAASTPRSYISSRESTPAMGYLAPGPEECGEGVVIKEGVTTILLS
ncbi:hypothetical protein SISSUDRAFT_1060478 [Sistotremastrum suecicum HHB10207 ss-3]|uniref:Uncharacterized protein n=1 Tax=Sistotremastrum suecicum HHB10207 ss-3 TaxID=1314776 RepID=A0A166F4K4_9AGAM|nr:hypothetical protein SISSUDRAFT_1060478 [Sistotremastrum suecicum HHB10207 ss-3]